MCISISIQYLDFMGCTWCHSFLHLGHSVDPGWLVYWPLSSSSSISTLIPFHVCVLQREGSWERKGRDVDGKRQGRRERVLVGWWRRLIKACGKEWSVGIKRERKRGQKTRKSRKENKRNYRFVDISEGCY